jgi:hypothetical protein
MEEQVEMTKEKVRYISHLKLTGMQKTLSGMELTVVSFERAGMKGKAIKVKILPETQF